MISNNLKSKKYFQAIVEAISYWLGYQSKIGREQIIHEASLRYPIIDTITANGVEINRIVLEKSHPIFKSKIIDLVIYAENMETIFEFKLAKKITGDEYGNEHQRVFNDMIRLAYHNKLHKKDCYFLMCGTYIDFNTYFLGQQSKKLKKQDKIVTKKHKPEKIADYESVELYSNLPDLEETKGWKSSGLYSDWFGFAPGRETIKEFRVTDNDKWGLKKFNAKYIVRKGVDCSLLDIIKLKTTCVAIIPYEIGKERTHVAGIWKIEFEE